MDVICFVKKFVECVVKWGYFVIVIIDYGVV